MSEDVIDYGDDAQSAAEHAEGLFAELHKLADELAAADKAVIEAEENLRKSRWLSAELRERRIPALMERMGLTKCSHGDLEVEIESKVHGGLPSMDKDPEKRIQALEWFARNGEGKILRNQFEIPLPVGDQEAAEHLKEMLSSEGLEFDQKTTIHPQTLLKWVRDRLRDGKEVPMELLNIHEQKLAKIKIKK